MNLKVFIGACVLSGLVACSSVKQDEAGLSRPGVSLELAQFRKEHFSNVRYNLFFSIPESRDEAIRGKVELSLRLDEKQPLIIDFRGEPEQVTSVTLNGGDIPYEVKDEHIVIASDWVAVGENRVAITFTPADQSLNRRDEFLYTLLVPDRAPWKFLPLGRLWRMALSHKRIVRASPVGIVFLSRRRNRLVPTCSHSWPVN